jgi:hypothetical protein
LPLLHLPAETLAQFVGPPLDQGVVWHALNRAICSAQLHFDFGRFTQQSLQPFLELGTLLGIRILQREIRRANCFLAIHVTSPLP